MKKIALFSVFYVCWFIASDNKGTQVPARVLPINVPSQESVERLQDAIATLPSSYFPLIDNQDLDRIFDLPIAEYKSNENINTLLQQNHDIEQYLNPRQRFALQYYLHNTLASGISDLDLERVEFALQYFNQDQLNQHHPAILFEIARRDNLTEDQETIRRQIFVKLLQAGADPFPIFASEQTGLRKIPFDRTKFREENLNKDLFYNIFTLPNVFKDIDLMMFLFESCKAYTKLEYKDSYRNRGLIWSISSVLNNLIADVNVTLNNVSGESLLHAFANEQHFLEGKNFKDLQKKYPNIELFLQKILKLCIELGANVNVQDIMSVTPLHAAVVKASPNIVKLLLEAGANPNIYDFTGETSVFKVIDAELIPLLVQHGANLNFQNWDGDTSLHRAAKMSNYDKISALLQYGADPSIINKKGEKPSNLVNRYDQIIKQTSDRKRQQELVNDPQMKQLLQDEQRIKQLFEGLKNEKVFESWMQASKEHFGEPSKKSKSRSFPVSQAIRRMLVDREYNL